MLGQNQIFSFIKKVQNLSIKNHSDAPDSRLLVQNENLATLFYLKIPTFCSTKLALLNLNLKSNSIVYNFLLNAAFYA